jgi:hypothetical protein
MSNDNPINGHNLNLPTSIPQGDPNVIRNLQHLLQLAQSGAVVGVACVGITGDGHVHQSLALPQNPQAVILTLGALETLKPHLLMSIQQMQQKANVSPIIKPGMFQSR